MKDVAERRTGPNAPSETGWWRLMELPESREGYETDPNPSQFDFNRGSNVNLVRDRGPEVDIRIRCLDRNQQGIPGTTY